MSAPFEELEIAAFKHVVVPIGVVIGLGVARMVSAGSEYLQHRSRVRFDLGHGLWSVTIFLWFIGLWWIAWGLRHVEASQWSYFTLIFLLLGPCFMYVAVTLLLPQLPDRETLDLGAHLASHRSAFFAALAGMLLWLFGSEVWLLREPVLVLPKRLLQGSGLALFAIGAFTSSRRVLGVIGGLTLLIAVFALSTVRARLG